MSNINYLTIKYFKGIIDVCLHYSKFPNVMEDYDDASWVNDKKKFIILVVSSVLLGDGAISYRFT